MRGSILAAVLALGLGLPCAPALADSSSPLLAAYYDRFMAISSGFTYTWVGDGAPSAVGKNVRQVGVGRGKYYALTNDGVLWGSRRIGAHGEMLGDVLMRDVTRFSAGRTGVLAIRNDGGLWWRAADAAVAQKIADDVVHAAVGEQRELLCHIVRGAVCQRISPSRPVRRWSSESDRYVCPDGIRRRPCARPYGPRPDPVA